MAGLDDIGLANDLALEARPHLVLLGAGASLAALPAGDRNGRRLPLMNQLVSVLGLESVLKEHGVKEEGLNDFEALYGSLATNPNRSELLMELQRRVYDYFADLELPDEPTLYDRLLLSLRRKDVVATFNWDPLLCQAYDRNRKRMAELPSLFFLHGSVRAGACPAHPRRVGMPGLRCPDCGEGFSKSPLLYPVQQKNYSKDPFIAGEWRAVTAALNEAFTFTAFGYSAPTSDVEAKALLHEAWDTNRSRELVQTEIIDIKCREELEATWQPFFFSQHFTLAESLEECSIGLYPRRSCEALVRRHRDAEWVAPARLPKDASFDHLYSFIAPYLEAERAKELA